MSLILIKSIEGMISLALLKYLSLSRTIGMSLVYLRKVTNL